MITRFTFLLLLFTSFFSMVVSSSSCKKADDDMGNHMPAPVCDSTLTPVIFIHGFLASGDTYALQAQRFRANDYCAGRIFAFDWNTLTGQQSAVPLLDALIDEVLAKTNSTKVNLAGHSAGGGLGYGYLSDPVRAAKVAYYAHIGSSAQSSAAGPNAEIPTINIWSDGDKVVQSADIPGATNVMISGLDHYQIATSTSTFEAMYRFFNNGADPKTTSPKEEPEIMLSGKVLSLGENKPGQGVAVEIYEVNPATGSRKNAVPDGALITDADGNWGPWQAKAGITYEFFVPAATSADRPVHYFREGFSSSDNLVYLRTIPPPGTFAGLLLAGVPKDDGQTVIAVFSSTQAVIHQRDELSVDGFDLATADYAAADRTAIAFFLYDNGDGMTSGDQHPNFAFFTSFLTGVDYFIPAEPAGSVNLKFNGRDLNVPNLKSETDGIIVAVFN